uniref:Innexin n=1 Tax=Macrostomum lignano TaxID=282301 RepID=A0A1I8HWQ5_9PLAT
MVVQEFLDRMSKMEVLTYVGLDDWFDRLNFLITVWLLLLMSTVTTVKTYFLQPIICYIPNIVGSHEGQAAYITNYCYTEGTYNVPLAEFKVDNENPRWMEAYKDKKIYYYQWLPFVLGLQGVLCYAPRIVWYLFINNRSGTDLTQLVRQTVELQKAEGDRREKLMKHLCRQIELWIRGNMPIHKYGKCKTVRDFVLNWAPGLLWSKRLGTWLIIVYLLVKLFYICNAAGQLVLMTRLLQLTELPENKNSSLLRITSTFGADLLRDLLQGRDWQNTGVFPRSGCCAIETRQASSSQFIFAQCALPVNMIHEKLYIFLWFWFVFLLLMNVLSVPLWLFRFCSAYGRSSTVIKHLRLSGAVSKEKSGSIDAGLEFCREFLRFDGVFLVHMLVLNAGEVVVTDMCTELFSIYNASYREQLDEVVSEAGSAGRRHRHRNENGRLPPNLPSDPQLMPLVAKCNSSSSLNRRNGQRRGLQTLSEDVAEAQTPSSPGADLRLPTAPPAECSATTAQPTRQSTGNNSTINKTIYRQQQHKKQDNLQATTAQPTRQSTGNNSTTNKTIYRQQQHNQQDNLQATTVQPTRQSTGNNSTTNKTIYRQQQHNQQDNLQATTAQPTRQFTGNNSTTNKTIYRQQQHNQQDNLQATTAQETRQSTGNNSTTNKTIYRQQQHNQQDNLQATTAQSTRQSTGNNSTTNKTIYKQQQHNQQDNLQATTAQPTRQSTGNNSKNNKTIYRQQQQKQQDNLQATTATNKTIYRQQQHNQQDNLQATTAQPTRQSTGNNSTSNKTIYRQQQHKQQDNLQATTAQPTRQSTGNNSKNNKTIYRQQQHKQQDNLQATTAQATRQSTGNNSTSNKTIYRQQQHKRSNLWKMTIIKTTNKFKYKKGHPAVRRNLVPGGTRGAAPSQRLQLGHGHRLLFSVPPPASATAFAFAAAAAKLQQPAGQQAGELLAEFPAEQIVRHNVDGGVQHHQQVGHLVEGEHRHADRAVGVHRPDAPEHVRHRGGDLAGEEQADDSDQHQVGVATTPLAGVDLTAAAAGAADLQDQEDVHDGDADEGQSHHQQQPRGEVLLAVQPAGRIAEALQGVIQPEPVGPVVPEDHLFEGARQRIDAGSGEDGADHAVDDSAAATTLGDERVANHHVAVDGEGQETEDVFVRKVSSDMSSTMVSATDSAIRYRLVLLLRMDFLDSTTRERQLASTPRQQMAVPAQPNM